MTAHEVVPAVLGELHWATRAIAHPTMIWLPHVYAHFLNHFSCMDKNLVPGVLITGDVCHSKIGVRRIIFPLITGDGPPLSKEESHLFLFLRSVLMHLRSIESSEIPYVWPCRHHHVIWCSWYVEGFGNEATKHLCTIPPVLKGCWPMLVVPRPIIASAYSLCDVPRDVVAAKKFPYLSELLLHLLNWVLFVDDFVVEGLRRHLVHRRFDGRARCDDDEEAASEALGGGVDE
mmetsp:Transcript_27319/g.52975  ORF Transcript_27319/g.52975 Transcript_27319/m.52975 type:complete len:232 (+) Transcript_27319:844-1539(+)